MDPGLRDPLDPRLARRLRAAVVAHVATRPRGAVAPVLHVGVPGAAVATWDTAPEGHDDTDHSLRCDVVGALLRRTSSVGRPLAWLTRGGALGTTEDADLAWLAAARTAYDERGLPLVLVVVTRQGWRDPRSGLTRTWTRLRAT